MLKISENYSLLNHNTFHLEAYSRYFIQYSGEDELKEALKLPIVRNNKVLHIGGGSNLLFTSDYSGVVLHSAIRGIEIINENHESISIRVGAAEIWDDVVAYCVAANLYGAENLSLIPGETGAAAVQNIGAYGVELKDIIETVEVVDIDNGVSKVFSNADCRYAYRNSVFKTELKDKYIITRVVLKLSKTPQLNLDYGNIKDSLPKSEEINLSTVRQTIISIRESKLPNPNLVGNAGSFFMNPYVTVEKYNTLKHKFPQIPFYPISDKLVKVPAAWLIEQCGWKGKSFGNAAVHDKQCLVIINKGGATASEIVELSIQIRFTVKEKFDIELIPEVIFL